MDTSIVDLKVFAHRYRQALLFAMIEGLNEGAAFSFLDDRDPKEIETELASAGLEGYRWIRKDKNSKTDALYLIERKAKGVAKDGCCGCCGLSND